MDKPTCATCPFYEPPNEPDQCAQLNIMVTPEFVCGHHPDFAAYYAACDKIESLRTKLEATEAENARLRDVAREAYQEGFQAAKNGAAIEGEAYSNSDARKALEGTT